MVNVGKEIAVLKQMTVVELRAKYAEVFGDQTRSRHKEFLVKRIVWRLQSQAEGDLSERARKQAAELASDADIRMTAPKTPAKAAPGCAEASAGRLERTCVAEIHISPDKRLPMPGAVITREYKGRLVAMTVLPNGFEYEGKVYRSLTAVAKAVTGTHWNGYHFFNLLKDGGDHAAWKRSALGAPNGFGDPAGAACAQRRGGRLRGHRPVRACHAGAGNADHEHAQPCPRHPGGDSLPAPHRARS